MNFSDFHATSLVNKSSAPSPNPPQACNRKHKHAEQDTHTPGGHPSDLLAQQEAGPYGENVGIGKPGHFLRFSKEKQE